MGATPGASLGSRELTDVVAVPGPRTRASPVPTVGPRVETSPVATLGPQVRAIVVAPLGPSERAALVPAPGPPARAAMVSAPDPPARAARIPPPITGPRAPPDPLPAGEGLAARRPRGRVGRHVCAVQGAQEHERHVNERDKVVDRGAHHVVDPGRLVVVVEDGVRRQQAKLPDAHAVFARVAEGEARGAVTDVRDCAERELPAEQEVLRGEVRHLVDAHEVRVYVVEREVAGLGPVDEVDVVDAAPAAVEWGWGGGRAGGRGGAEWGRRPPE